MHKTDLAVEAAQVAPATSVALLSFWGYNVSDWTYLAFLIYTLMLIAHFVWKKLVRPWQRWRRKRCMQGK